MPEKAVYSLTAAGEKEFEKLRLETDCKPIHIFLDYNAVIVNLDSFPTKRAGNRNMDCFAKKV